MSPSENRALPVPSETQNNIWAFSLEGQLKTKSKLIGITIYTELSAKSPVRGNFRAA